MRRRSFFIVLAGRISVTITGPTGREILLYEVGDGETCVQTTLALLGGQHYEGEAMVTEEAEAVAIPRPLFDRLMGESTVFRAFVFGSFGRRLTDVIHLLEKVAFVPIESRIAAVLLDRAGSGRASTRPTRTLLRRSARRARSSAGGSMRCATAASSTSAAAS